MKTRRQAQTVPNAGDNRSALFLTLAGALLLASTLTNLWAGSVVVPASLAVASLVYGAYLTCFSGNFLARDRDARRSAVEFHETSPDPVFVTDLNGDVLSKNAAAASAGFVDRWVADSGALIYRLVRDACAAGQAAETVGSGMGRLSVTRIGANTLLWRLDQNSHSGQGGIEARDINLPWLRVAPDGTVLGANPAAVKLSERPIKRVEDLFSDPPLRTGGFHMLRDSGLGIKALKLGQTAAYCDVVLCEPNEGEVSGLAPDQFLEELPVALARLQPDGELTFANKAARHLIGAGAQPGANLCDLIEGLGRSISERLQDATKDRALGRSEVARGKSEGHQLFLQVAFTKTIDGGVPSLMAVLSDATELKTLEAQFVQSQKMQAVGQLAGGVAHDFNNLLTAINGHCDLLLMRHDVADVEHGDLMQIRQNANRAAALVRQLLAFSRKQTLRPTVINLQDTLSELTHLLNRLLSEKVTLRIKHGADVAPVRVDERQFEQVIMNLVVNARDAMPRGGEVRITTRSVHLDEDLHRDRAVVFKGDYVVVEVADSGTGIPQDKLNKIFEPFYTTKQVGEGTGLGLSTVYGIIKQTGGFIFADSPSSGGAVFTIYLPAYETIDAVEVGEPEVKQPRDLTGRGVVLLVEDEDAVRSFAARALQLRGYTVVEAASGEEALELLRDGSLNADILLSDVIMPGLDGPAWVREARKSFPDTKVIFMSGYTEDAFVGGDSGIPDAGFLPKPFTLPELTQKVKDALDS